MRHVYFTSVLFLAAIGVSAQPSFILIDLGIADVSSVGRINDQGQLVGSYRPAGVGSPIEHAFIWLPRPAGGLSVGLNDLGVLGGATSSSFGSGRMSDLNDLISPRPEWQLRWASGINNRGQIVGMALVDGVFRAFRLDPAAMVFYDGFESGDLSVWSP